MEDMIMQYHNSYHHTVTKSQSEVAVMQSDNNQPRQHDESGLVEHNNGLCISKHICGIFIN